MMNLHYMDYIVFGLLLFISAMVGPYYMWRDRNGPTTSESYFMGNRGLHIVPTAASLFASFWSAIAIVGVPAELYTAGARFFMASLGQATAAIIAAFVAVPMFYKLRLISSFEYFELRFHSRLLRKIGAVTNFLASAFYLASVTYAPCVALEVVTPIPVWASVITTAAITMIYTVLGGIKAVVLVDLIQSFVMFGGIIIAIVIGYAKIEGGFSKAMDISRQNDRLDFFDFNPDLRTYNFWILAISQIFPNGGLFATSQASVQRYSALPSVKQASLSVFMIGPQVLVLYVLLFFMANAMFAHYDAQGCDPLRGGIISNPNQLTTFYVAEILNYPGLVGVWFSALFSGSLSTMSTGYNSVAACIWEDLLKEKLEKRLSQRGISNVLKLISLTLGIVSCILALGFQFVQGNIIRITNSTANTISTAIFIVFFSGTMFPFVNAFGCIVGMMVATITSSFFVGGQMFYKLGNQQAWLPTKTANCSAIFSNLIASGRFKATPEQLKRFGNVATMILTASTAGLHTNFPNSTSLTLSSSNLNIGYNDTVLLLPAINLARLPEIPTPGANETALDAEALPKPLLYLFSMSYFMFPFLTLVVGVIVAVLVSLCTGGLQIAKIVNPRFMVVKNCFFKDDRILERQDANVSMKLDNVRLEDGNLEATKPTNWHEKQKMSELVPFFYEAPEPQQNHF